VDSTPAAPDVVELESELVCSADELVSCFVGGLVAVLADVGRGGGVEVVVELELELE
jgi:hypothetical protein